MLELKFDISENCGAPVTQLSSVRFFDASSRVIQPSSVSNSKANNPINETAAQLLLREGKWLDRRQNPTLIFTFPTTQKPCSYNFITANDCPTRDPRVWTISQRHQGKEWKVICSKCTKPPTERNTSYGIFSIEEEKDERSYFKLEITKNNGATATQLSHVAFYDAERNPLIPSSVVNAGGYNPNGEVPQKLIKKDGKWLDRNRTSTLLFCFPKGTMLISSYEFFTANDFPERDPSCWTVSVGNDPEALRIVHSKIVQSPTTRNSSYGKLFEMKPSNTRSFRRNRRNPAVRCGSRWAQALTPAVSLIPTPSQIRLKLEITKNLGAPLTQLSSVLFYDANNNVIRPLSINNPNGKHPKNEGPAKLLGEEGKWLDKHETSTLVFHFDCEVTDYELVTGNDFRARDPVCWVLSKQIESEEKWEKVDSRCLISPSERNSSYGKMKIGGIESCGEVVEKEEPFSATASRNGKFSCDNLFTATRYWNSGAMAPQWVQIDLGKKTSVSFISMVVDQVPAGFAKHEIYGRASVSAPEVKLATISRNSQKGETIELCMAPVDIQFIRIHTLESPSWVAWRDIKIGKKEFAHNNAKKASFSTLVCF